jgi:pyrroloquinoline quinone biosynthesis protein B
VDIEPSVRAKAIEVPHRMEYSDTLGWRIEGPRSTVLYVPDCDPLSKWEQKPAEVLAGVDLLLLDGTFYSMDELPGRDTASLRHPLIIDSMDLLQPFVEADELEVWFIHLNHSNPALGPGSPERGEIERRGFAVAANGAEFPL